MNALQRYIVARVARQEAEAVEKSLRAEVFAALEQAGLPQIVEVSGRSFLLRIGTEAGKKFITMLEVAPSQSPNKQAAAQTNESSPTAKPTASEVSAPKEAAPKREEPQSNKPPSKPQRNIVCCVSSALYAQIAKIAKDENRRQSEVVEDLVANGLVALGEGQALPSDCGSGNLHLSFSGDLAAEVSEMAKERGVGVSQITRQIVLLGLEGA